jgi:hypothetical protein
MVLGRDNLPLDWWEGIQGRKIKFFGCEENFSPGQDEDGDDLERTYLCEDCCDRDGCNMADNPGIVEDNYINFLNGGKESLLQEDRVILLSQEIDKRIERMQSI